MAEAIEVSLVIGGVSAMRRLLLLFLLIIFSSHHHVFFSISNYYCKPRSYNFTNMIPEVV